ncbi:MAG: toprim domain-containing protein [Alphaproteobacteria bacterium]|nr:toprim domain-containing protein [Alphaproteobacteria bacterium]
MLDNGMELACAQARAEDDARRTRYALSVYRETVPIAGTPAERYLLGPRGIAKPKRWPADLRFHPACPRGAERLPAMVALMRDIVSDAPRGVHRTFLKPDGSSKNTDGGEAAKMMLGPSAGAAVKLTPDAEVTLGLGIAEGIETALSVWGLGWPMWSCLSVGTIAKFPVLKGIEALTIFADHDEKAAGEKGARACEARWVKAGAEVRIVLPKRDGTDWNDVLKGGVL